MWAVGPYLPSGTQDDIKLIAKKGKDPLLPGSYRPISLINVDTNILSKILATQLARLLPSILHQLSQGLSQANWLPLTYEKFCWLMNMPGPALTRIHLA